MFLSNVLAIAIQTLEKKDFTCVNDGSQEFPIDEPHRAATTVARTRIHERRLKTINQKKHMNRQKFP